MKYPIVVTIDYDTKDDANWRLCMLAYTAEDAVSFLRQRVKTLSRINTIDTGKQINSIHPKVIEDNFRENVVEEVEVEVIREVPVEIVKEVYVNSPDGDMPPICPWCQKEFKTLPALKAHCTKNHLK